jgi:hypothetical protein
MSMESPTDEPERDPDESSDLFRAITGFLAEKRKEQPDPEVQRAKEQLSQQFLESMVTLLGLRGGTDPNKRSEVVEKHFRHYKVSLQHLQESLEHPDAILISVLTNLNLDDIADFAKSKVTAAQVQIDEIVPGTDPYREKQSFINFWSRLEEITRTAAQNDTEQ